MIGWIGAEGIAGELKAIEFAIKFISDEPHGPIAQWVIVRLESSRLVTQAKPAILSITFMPLQDWLMRQ